ncbi:MAG: NACHT domain-containing protein [Chloroflexaceae bacterium]|nr:NACHT domain-containing protein [Chloroflexaceae bacterium]
MNPFTERKRITQPERFVGRWRELSVIFDRLDTGRPVLVGGVAGIGKSSLLTHIAQSAAVNLERPDLLALYADMAPAEDEAALFHLITRSLGSRGDSEAALEVALLERAEPVLLCLDNADRAIAAGWGAATLEKLARLARRSLRYLPAGMPLPLPGQPSSPVPTTAAMEPTFLLVAACHGRPPVLSEPFATVTLGAISSPEVRLLTDAYLDYTGVSFSPADLRELEEVSLGHPAYLQRAAYQLYIARSSDPTYDWKAAYFADAQNRPIPGAPLPPVVFEGGRAADPYGSFYGMDDVTRRLHLDRMDIAAPDDLPLFLLPLVVFLVAWQVSGNLLIGGVTLLITIGVVMLARRLVGARSRQPEQPIASDSSGQQQEEQHAE